jgi:hypothetical protein
MKNERDESILLCVAADSVQSHCRAIFFSCIGCLLYVNSSQVAFRCRMLRDYNRMRDDMIFERIANECIESLCDFLGLEHRFNINATSVEHQCVLLFAEMIG